MKSNLSRRNWLKKLSAGTAGLLFSQQVFSNNKKEQNKPFNNVKALVSPKDNIKITRLEVIPVHSLRTIFIKMHTAPALLA